jgi:hypothetical protein
VGADDLAAVDALEVDAGDAGGGPRSTPITPTSPGKLLYPAIHNAVPAWTRPRNWTTAPLAFKIHFGDR